MNQQRPLWPLLIVAAIVAYYFYSKTSDSPSVPRPDGPDLLEAFAQSDDKHEAKCDAEVFGGLCESVAAVLEYDGQLQDPRVTTGVQIDDLRRWVRDYSTGGKTFKSKYPRLSDTVKEFLDKAAGSSGSPLDATRRQAWVNALRKLGASAKWAASQLE